jgi:hypothetical protein
MPSRVTITLSFYMLESLDQDSTSPCTKAMLFPLSSRKDMDTRFFSKLGTYNTLLKWTLLPNLNLRDT